MTVRGSELNQVWTNLLDNAIGALGEQGTITIRARADDNCAIVAVCAIIRAMTSPPRDMTAQALLQYRNEPYRQELIAGRLQEVEPAGALHGAVAAQVGALLAAHVTRHGLGRTFGAETGFHIRSDPDTVRAPDASFVTRDRIAVTGIPAGYWPGPPDLAVEVISPSDRGAQVEAKALDWLEAGSHVVVVLDPSQRTADVYRGSSRIECLGVADTLDLDDVVTGFAVAVADLFV